MKKLFPLFLAGILLVLLVASMFGIEEVVAALAGANPAYILAAVGLQFVVLLIIGARQHVLAGGAVSFWKNFRVAMSGNFVNLIVPGPAVGGESLKVYLLGKDFEATKATAIIAVDDFVEILGTLLVVLFAVVFFVPVIAPELKTIFAVFILIVILIMTGVMKVLLTPRWLKKVVKWLVRKISGYQHIENKDYANMFHSAFVVLLKQKKTLLAALGLTIAMKVLEFAVLWLAFSSIGTTLPLTQIVVLWSIIVVFLFIPWLPGSLGLVEFGAASTLVTMGLAGSAAASGILINRFISFWFVLLVGIFAIFRTRNSGELPKATRLSEVDKVHDTKPKRRRAK